MDNFIIVIVWVIMGIALAIPTISFLYNLDKILYNRIIKIKGGQI
jgi:hypothetical protein